MSCMYSCILTHSHQQSGPVCIPHPRWLSQDRHWRRSLVQVLCLLLEHKKQIYTHYSAAFWLELQWFTRAWEGPAGVVVLIPRPLDLLFRFACSRARWRLRLLGSLLLPLRRLLKCSLFRLLQLLHPQRHPAFAVASCAFFPENAAALVASRPAAAASRRFTWGEFVAEASAGASPSTTPALLLSPLRCLRSTSLQVHVPPRRWRRTSIL